MVKDNLISVIIPYFNKVNTIERAVESVINQTYQNWEIWIVDDCSEIKLETRKNWENLPIYLLHNEQNLGPGPSRQRALDLAKGKYVSFLDADDYWSRNFLKLSIEGHILNSDNIAFTWSLTKTKLHNGEFLRKHNNLDLNKITETLIKYGHPWSTSSILWNREFCSEWKSLNTNQDSLFEFDSSFKNNNVFRINKVLCFKDETTGIHRVNLVQREVIINNRYILYKYILKRKFDNLSLINKILLINRIVWCLSKISEIENAQAKNKYKSKLKYLFYLSIHKTLQIIKFKIYIGQ